MNYIEEKGKKKFIEKNNNIGVEVEEQGEEEESNFLGHSKEQYVVDEDNQGGEYIAEGEEAEEYMEEEGGEEEEEYMDEEEYNNEEYLEEGNENEEGNEIGEGEQGFVYLNEELPKENWKILIYIKNNV